MAELVRASRLAATSASSRSSSGASPTTTASIGAPCDPPPRPRQPAGRRRGAPPAGSARSPASQSRSSLSCRRASLATSSGSSARFCMSASVCRTESWRCAATSARSSERARGHPLRVPSRLAIDHQNGAEISSRAIVTTKAASATLPADSSTPVNQKKNRAAPTSTPTANPTLETRLVSWLRAGERTLSRSRAGRWPVLGAGPEGSLRPTRQDAAAVHGNDTTRAEVDHSPPAAAERRRGPGSRSRPPARSNRSPHSRRITSRIPASGCPPPAGGGRSRRHGVRSGRVPRP